MRQNQVAEGTDALLNLVDYADRPPSRRDRGQSFPFNAQGTTASSVLIASTGSSGSARAAT